MARQKVTALIYDKKGRLLATGHNSYTKTHPKQAHFARLAGAERKTYLHAEIAAIIRAGPAAYAIHVLRYRRDGSLALARPCEICMLAIRESGIKEISYST
jgi:deoxycytidylate deaminase